MLTHCSSTQRRKPLTWLNKTAVTQQELLTTQTTQSRQETKKGADNSNKMEPLFITTDFSNTINNCQESNVLSLNPQNNPFSSVN